MPLARTRSTPERPARTRLGLGLFAAALVAAPALGCGSAVRAAHTDPDPAAYLYRLTIDHCRITVPQLATAFRIDDDTLLTAAHPLVDAHAVVVTTADGVEVGAAVTVLAPERDLAVLRLDVPAAAGGAIPLAATEVEPGDAVSLPTFDGDGRIEVQPARVVRRAQVTLDGEDERRSIELEADIVSGDSGGPVVAEGTATGVVFASTRGADRGWAVSLPEMQRVLAEDVGLTVPLSCDD